MNKPHRETSFEQTGIALQEEAITRTQAIKNFSNSCYYCEQHGNRYDCESCNIKKAHNEKIETFDLIAECEEIRRNYPLRYEKRCDKLCSQYINKLITQADFRYLLLKIANEILEEDSLKNNHKEKTHMNEEINNKEVILDTLVRGKIQHNIKYKYNKMELLVSKKQEENALVWDLNDTIVINFIGFKLLLKDLQRGLKTCSLISWVYAEIALDVWEQQLILIEIIDGVINFTVQQDNMQENKSPVISILESL